MRALIDSPESIGLFVRRIREQNGMSQRQLAAALGTSQRYITELENGLPKRIDQRYIDLLRRLGITIALETSEPTDHG